MIFIASEYQFYQTKIRIYDEKDVLDVPIEAYPILCEPGKLLLPKIVDFGLAQVGQRYQEIYQIDNNTGMDFKFGFQGKEEVEEIQINPPKGIIPKYGYIKIEVSFKPGKQQTYHSQFYVRLKDID